jgi:8-oxo-dGTP pyrophosphatase MutT (NUDIX family)
MKTRPWERRAREAVLDTRIFKLERHRLASPRTGLEHDFFIIEAPDWCNIVPITDEGEVVMVRQQRHGTGEETLELPGGMIDPTDPSPLEAARRELLEETGYAARTVEAIGVIAPNPAMQSNRCHSFLARGLQRIGEPALDGGEDIAVVKVRLEEIPARVARGEICHALVVVAFTWALGLRPPDVPR